MARKSPTQALEDLVTATRLAALERASLVLRLQPRTVQASHPAESRRARRDRRSDRAIAARDRSARARISNRCASCDGSHLRAQGTPEEGEDGPLIEAMGLRTVACARQTTPAGPAHPLMSTRNP